MTAKEKAQEIWDKMMYHIMYNCQPTLSEMVAKQCALIAVDEIDKAIGWHPFEVPNKEIEYWQEVKNELNKL